MPQPSAVLFVGYLQGTMHSRDRRLSLNVQDGRLDSAQLSAYLTGKNGSVACRQHFRLYRRDRSPHPCQQGGRNPLALNTEDCTWIRMITLSTVAGSAATNSENSSPVPSVPGRITRQVTDRFVLCGFPDDRAAWRIVPQRWFTTRVSRETRLGIAQPSGSSSARKRSLSR